MTYPHPFLGGCSPLISYAIRAQQERERRRARDMVLARSLGECAGVPDVIAGFMSVYSGTEPLVTMGRVHTLPDNELKQHA